MLLPCGVTGYDCTPADVRVPSLREFRADCWQVAIPLNAKVENHETEMCASFVSHTLVWPHGAVAVLLNNNYPIFALCEPFDAGTIEFKFVDNAKVAELFGKFGKYEVWSKDTLELPVLGEMSKNLGPKERRKLDYFWSGRTRVGDIVFNHWD